MPGILAVVLEGCAKAATANETVIGTNISWHFAQDVMPNGSTWQCKDLTLLCPADLWYSQGLLKGTSRAQPGRAPVYLGPHSGATGGLTPFPHHRSWSHAHGPRGWRPQTTPPQPKGSLVIQKLWHKLCSELGNTFPEVVALGAKRLKA